MSDADLSAAVKPILRNGTAHPGGQWSDPYETMKNGTCPKCNVQEIYVNTTETHGIHVPLGRDFVFTEEYVCSTCGYLEFYVQHKADLQRVSERYRKVKTE